jgi:hypothetical protein
MGSFTNQPDFATRAMEITPSDDLTPDNNLGKAALYISDAAAATCTVTVQMPDRNGDLAPVTFKNVPRGTFLPICVDYLLAEGTTATRIIAYW